MRHSAVDKRASRRPAKQCVSDHGMHKDAEPVERAGETWSFKPRTGRVIFSAAPNGEQRVKASYRFGIGLLAE